MQAGSHTDKHTDRQTVIKVSRQAGKQTSNNTGRQTIVDRQIDIHTGKQELYKQT